MDIKLLTDRAEGPLGTPRSILSKGCNRHSRALPLIQNASMYAIVWDGYATLEGRKWDAILVEVGESIRPTGAIYAQRYEAKEQGIFSKKRRNVAVGKPQLVGSAPSRLCTEAQQFIQR